MRLVWHLIVAGILENFHHVIAWVEAQLNQSFLQAFRAFRIFRNNMAAKDMQKTEL